MGSPMRYPENHVIGIVDTPEAATAAGHDLTGDGSDLSEVEPAGGGSRFLGKRKGLAALASANPSSLLVAGARNHRNRLAYSSRLTSSDRLPAESTARS